MADPNMVMTEAEILELEQVKIFSIVVGIFIVIVCVVPCVLFALLAKCFQKQRPHRKSSTIRSIITNMKFLDAKDALEPLGSTGLGTYGPIQISPDQIDYVDKIVNLKSRLSCVVAWKAYAPTIMMGSEDDLSERRIVMVKKLGVVPISDIQSSKDGANHNSCIKAELSTLSQIPPHHLLLNLLGVCLHNSSPAALIMEYPPYGCLHTYLLIKRRARISNSTMLWGGLKLTSDEPLVIKALPETERPHLSMLLDSYDSRSRAFNIPLNESFSELDELLFALQVGFAMEFLIDQGFLHKRLSTENIVISPGFHLKVMGMDFEPPPVHRNVRSNASLRRTASGRNLVKWDAPEVIDGLSYSEKSEIWRFAMTWWEICSLGDAPFIDVPTRALGDLLKRGEIPLKPERTSHDIYSLMTSCWNIVPTDRPTFSEVVDNIQSMLRRHEYSSDGYIPNGRLSPLHSPIETTMNAEFPTSCDSGTSPGDSTTLNGSLHRRLSKRPVVLPLQIAESVTLDKSLSPSVDSSGTFGESGETPLLEYMSPLTQIAGYLETDV